MHILIHFYINTHIESLEKQLREAAAMEVASLSGSLAENDKSRKRKNLNNDEKAKQNRERNREHAKNTRLRKKAYVLKLKELVDQLTMQKESDDRDRISLAEKIYDTHVTRKNAVRTFLNYRALGVQDYDKLSVILDDDVSFILPITPYRSFNITEVVNSCRVIKGINAVITDTASLGILVETIGYNSHEWIDYIKRHHTARAFYSINKDDIVAGGDLVMCRFTFRIASPTSETVDDSDDAGACILHGMLQCRFNRFNKIVHAEMSFDVMGFMQQLHSIGTINPDHCIVPNTLEMAVQYTAVEARCVVKCTKNPDGSIKDYLVLYINELWTGITNFSQSQCEGLPLIEAIDIISSQAQQFNALLQECAVGRTKSGIFVKFQKQSAHSADKSSAKLNDELVLVYTKFLPLTTNDVNATTVSHILCCQRILPLTAGEQEALARQSQSL